MTRLEIAIANAIRVLLQVQIERDSVETPKVLSTKTRNQLTVADAELKEEIQ